MSESDITTVPGATGSETGRTGKAKQALGQAGETLKHEAQSFASAAQDRARAEAQRRTDAGARTLSDFAAAIRRAGDELSQTDHSPTARLVAQAADGLEGFASHLAGKQPEELLDAVRDFGRRNPAAFIGGAVLVGLALGRFVRASDTTHISRTGGLASPAYPVTQPVTYGAEALADDAMGLAEERGYDGPAEQGPGISAPVSDDLGDLRASTIEDSPTVMDEGISGEAAAGVEGVPRSTDEGR